jgi:2'-deoxynucleoside 5'-phosphate N-hydrolase
MKILFNSSVTGRDEYEENYKAIEENLNALGHEVTTPFFIGKKEDVKAETEKEAILYYNRLQKWLKESDILVFEVSYPSLGIGHEISWGLSLNKPVIVLYVKGKKPVVLDAIPNDKLQVVEYNTRNLSRQIKDALEYASEQQDTRFNFFISPKQQQFLDWVAKHKKIPRAVFLRNLIEEEMERDKEYSA